MSKRAKILLALLLPTVLIIVLVLFFNKPGSALQLDFNVSRYAPLSVAYFDCRLEGMVTGSTCSKCEQLYTEAESDRKAHNIATDQDLVAYIKAQDKDCVNQVQGGN